MREVINRPSDSRKWTSKIAFMFGKCLWYKCKRIISITKMHSTLSVSLPFLPLSQFYEPYHSRIEFIPNDLQRCTTA